MKAYIQHGNANTPMRTESVECRIETFLWQDKGLSYTASGYGSKIPTKYQVKHNNRWKRVYCRIYSNIGTLYIMQGKDKIIIDDIQD